jgi:hypothetical protein
MHISYNENQPKAYVKDFGRWTLLFSLLYLRLTHIRTNYSLEIWTN